MKKINIKKFNIMKVIKGMGIGILLLVVMIIGLRFMLFPKFDPIRPSGSHNIDTKLFTWEDSSRIETFNDSGDHRKVTAKFWYPTEPGKYPLIVFSHGAFGVVDSNLSTFEELASNGYVVASIGHPYHTLFLKDANGDTTFVDQNFMNEVYEDNGVDSEEAERKVYEKSKKWMELRTKDENFILDQIIMKTTADAQVPFCEINVDKIGLFGHSMGGATSVEVARMRTDIDAVIDLEGTMFGEYTGFEGGVQTFDETSFTIPVLDVYSKAIYDEAKSYGEEAYVNFYLGKRATDYRIELFEDAGHLNFTDLPMISPILAKKLGVGSVEPRTCIEKMNKMVLEYFDQYLKE